jgi:glutathione S-transferase
VELITIPFSHYNERARWAMAHHGVFAHERRYLPMLHRAAVARAVPQAQRLADRTGSGLSTPVLVLDDGTVINDSTKIMRWVDATYGTPETTLYPADQQESIAALEQKFHDDVGRDTRFLAYWFILGDAPTFAALVRHNVPGWQRAAFALGAPLAKAAMRKRFALTQANYEKIRARLEAAVATLSETLGDREYFVGDRFTAADLTAASMLSIMVLPLPGYGATIPDLHGPYVELRDQLRATALGKHALRMFERHRKPAPSGWTWA